MGGGLKSKAPQACETCRSLKVRCLPSSQPDTCLKCVNSKKTCVYLERQPRQRQPSNPKRGSKARICALESKIDSLIAFTSQSQLVPGQYDASFDTGLLSHGLSTPGSSSSHRERDLTSNSDASSSNPSFPDDPATKWADYPQVNGKSCPELLLECGLSIGAADEYLKCFRTMTSYFPFFILPSHATSLRMCKEQPFSLLAALAAATSTDKELQKSLAHKFKACAVHAIMVENERSIDLLNGILVYLAWYQFYYIPKKEQFNQLLHTAIGMVGDMGLNLRPAEAVRKRFGLRLTHYHKSHVHFGTHDDFFSPEARRAYLGCFYLSSVTGWATMKPNNLQFDNYMMECASSLGQELEHPTDALLLPLVRLQNMADLYHCDFSAIENNSHEYLNGLDLEMKVQAFKAEITQWKHSLPPIYQQLNGTNLAYEVAMIHAYEMDLVLISAVKNRRNPDCSYDSSTPSSMSQVRLEVLFLCLKSAAQHAQSLLSMSASQYDSLSYIQWTGLIYAITVIYRLTVGIPQVRDWDVRVARQTVDFDGILDAFCNRFNGMSLCGNAKLSNEELFSIMGPIFENIRQNYNRLKKLPQDQSAEDIHPVHGTSFLSSTSQNHLCPRFRTSGILGVGTP
ncbi:uncharacterized protein N7511_003038 [Penicillium nucicola]|uniref:uncharacterized protein n=1 Tax=Penicillium nucicola TaxID=1850975 RepID=UPI0025456C66|nr:uncharacterized protein N7511_003038 [Penicillium nucicola]KAJ5770987.1 hypothetical protein N7511_003038 [Penicillium nucicola]